MSKPFSSDIEKQLAQLWINVLNCEKVEKKNNFFCSGGDSMLAVTLLNDIFSTFNIKISLEELLVNSTFGDLAALIFQKL